MAQEIDSYKVDETIAFAENNSRCIEALERNYVTYIAKKKKKGQYDAKKSVKLLEYFYVNYVRPQMIKPMEYGMDPKLNVPKRKMFAEYFVESIENNYLTSAEEINNWATKKF